MRTIEAPTDERYADLKARNAAHQAWSEQYRKPSGWIVISPNEQATCPPEARISNDERSELEVAEWHRDPPDAYFLYVMRSKDDHAYAATWCGHALSVGPVALGPVWRDNMGGKRRSIRFMGTNGHEYAGWYFTSSGDYARVKRLKGKRR